MAASQVGILDFYQSQADLDGLVHALHSRWMRVAEPLDQPLAVDGTNLIQ
jgi:hypothetical protein